VVKFELDICGSGYGPVAVCCERDFKYSGYIKGEEFLD